MIDAVLGLDIGTSFVKAALFDLNGRLLAAARSHLGVSSPQPGWSEQDPEDWWQAACRAIRQTIDEAGETRLIGLGLSGQCPGHTLVDAEHRAIGPAILWSDRRAVQEGRWLSEHISPELARCSLGMELGGGAGMPPARLLWLKYHRSADWRRAACVLQPKDYVALKLTGRVATDVHSAYSLVNPESGRYEPEFFTAAGIDIDKMPPALAPTAVVGQVTGEAAALSGLPAGLPVIAGTIDAYCDNLGGGAACLGRAVDVCGTSEVISLPIQHPVEAPGVFTGRIGGEVQFLCAPTQCGGDTLHWLSECFYPRPGHAVDYPLLERDASSVPAGCQGLVFLPYLNGERAPIWDEQARGGFFGVTGRHAGAHFTRAVYEGVAFAVRHNLEVLEAAAGFTAGEVVVCGGGSASAFWNQVKADILKRPVRPAAVQQTGCLGAALLAAVGVKACPDLKSASQSMVQLKNALQPHKELAEVYDLNYRMYRQLYPALKPIFSPD